MNELEQLELDFGADFKQSPHYLDLAEISLKPKDLASMFKPIDGIDIDKLDPADKEWMKELVAAQKSYDHSKVGSECD